VSATARAEALARRHLASALPTRWQHVQAVAAKATSVGPAVRQDADLLSAAAWLHDIGYSPDLVDTGFHPLDGARYLRASGFDQRVARLVAHHSGAVFEASERGLREALLTEFEPDVSPVADLLWYCDMTVGPAGQPLTVEERLAEIASRYGPDHVVARSINSARRDIVLAVERADVLLASQPR
jgi:putative nucleotidyltransferase with HDIG domain